MLIEGGWRVSLCAEARWIDRLRRELRLLQALASGFHLTLLLHEAVGLQTLVTHPQLLHLHRLPAMLLDLYADLVPPQHFLLLEIPLCGIQCVRRGLFELRKRKLWS